MRDSESETRNAISEAPLRPSEDVNVEPPFARYEASELEQRWRDAWSDARSFAVPPLTDERAPAYVLASCWAAEPEGTEIEQIRGHAIADAYARFLRASGRAVLFSVGFDAFGAHVEGEAPRHGLSPTEWAARCCERTRRLLAELGCSCDWERTFVSSSPDQYRWTQWLFLAMLDRGIVYERGRRWRLRTSAYAEESERDLGQLSGWNEAAIDAQRAAIGRVEGVEIDVSTFDGRSLTAFAVDRDAIDRTEFVAISPNFSDVELWAAEPEIAKQLAAMRDADCSSERPAAAAAPVVETGVLATVPGVDGAVPIVISPLVDARFGPTVALGIPERDAADQIVAERLPKRPSIAWKTSKQQAAPPRAAVRYRVRDVTITRPGAWGAPVPLIECPSCGTVPVPVDDLPVRLPEDLLAPSDQRPLAERPDFYECSCPRCHGSARRATETIDDRVDAMWAWLPACVPPDERPAAMFAHAESERWLPADQLVEQDADRLFDERLASAILRDLGLLSIAPDRAPFSKVLLHEPIRLARAATSDDPTSDDPAGAADAVESTATDATDATALLADWGADAVRLAIFHAASPARPINWNERYVRESARFLTELYGYAERRLERASSTERAPHASVRIEASDKLRRRLAHWCEVARTKVTASLDSLELQRAAHNAMLLLARVQDFERLAIAARGELRSEDRDAIAAALLLLVRLLAPLTPHVAEELWSRAGGSTLVSDLAWPAPDEYVRHEQAAKRAAAA